MFSQIDLADFLVGDDFFRVPFRNNPAFIENVGPVADAERIPDVMFGYEDANATVAQVVDDPLDIDDGKRVNSRERFVEQHELGFAGQCAGDFHPPPLAAGQPNGRLVAKVRYAEFFQQFFDAKLRLAGGKVSAQLQYGAKIVGYRQFSEN